MKNERQININEGPDCSLYFIAEVEGDGQVKYKLNKNNVQIVPRGSI